MHIMLRRWQEMPFIKKSWFYMKNIFLIWHITQYLRWACRINVQSLFFYFILRLELLNLLRARIHESLNCWTGWTSCRPPPLQGWQVLLLLCSLLFLPIPSSICTTLLPLIPSIFSLYPLFVILGIEIRCTIISECSLPKLTIASDLKMAEIG